MTSKKAILTFLVVFVASLFAALPARAQSADKSEGWKFEITPYFWFSGLKTDFKAGLIPEKEIEVSFSKLSKMVHLGVAAQFEGRRGRWGFLFDGMYVDLGDTAPTPYGDVKFGMNMGNFSLAGMLRAVEGRSALDLLLLGVRYNTMGNDLEVTTGPYTGLKTSTTDSWVDAFAGARLRVWMVKWLMLEGYADIGAGGSRLAWQTWVGLNARFSRVFYGKVGYRYSYLDRSQDGGFVKITKSGIYAGLGINF